MNEEQLTKCILLDEVSESVGEPREDEVLIHTDGSASVKNKTGGWAFVARFRQHTAMRCGFVSATTISETELLAIKRALQFLAPAPYPVRIVTDSQYALKAVTVWNKGWAESGWLTSTGKPVAHKELIQAIVGLLDAHRGMREICIEWVRGHSNVPDNELADDLAGKARRSQAPETAKWVAGRDNKFQKLMKERNGNA